MYFFILLFPNLHEKFPLFLLNDEELHEPRIDDDVQEQEKMIQPGSKYLLNSTTSISSINQCMFDSNNVFIFVPIFYKIM
ncbi:hypothetical protein BLA29_014393 [Euroglyphus maynei]|uniref:Uncharacterized protein n=1 Tax=Euroglyphus maynei TaxID=6958 RepID=A0A1Y3BD29_EURMA|nr:hypothetical protein BLA29_014393 [Euroglyphus maynei]